jgi:ornithine cyclodeaminase/alanine dehydrogenase-like protein (mu-crystallin family)
MARFLTDADVDQCVDLGDMLPAIEEMLTNYGRGQATNLTRRKVATPGGYLAVMGGALLYQGVFGVKTFTHTENGYSFQVSLYDATSGRLLLYTQANRLGQLRTGATTAAAIKHLANPDAPRLGIIGTGNQAGDQLRAACAVREVGEIHAYSRNADNRRAFAARMTAELGRPVIAADSNQEAVAGCAVVIGIASAETPVIRGEWLDDGATVIGAGPTSPRHREVDDNVLLRAGRRFVDSLEQGPLECGDIAAAVDRGLVQWSQFHELRHAVAGVVPGRGTDGDVVYCKLMGTGVADVAAAKLLLERAESLGVGTELPL